MRAGEDWARMGYDPHLFTSLIECLGTSGVKVRELWGKEHDLNPVLGPVHGLIVFYKNGQSIESSGSIVTDSRLETIYFGKQVTTNANATQAVLNILLNCDHTAITLGPVLTELKASTMMLDPEKRGLAISNSATIRNAHNFVAQNSEFATEINGDDPLNYAAFVRKNGKLYELNSQCNGPIDHGEVPETANGNWVDNVRPLIMQKINAYDDANMCFCTMAFLTSRKRIYERQIDDLVEARGLDEDFVENEIRNLVMWIEFEDLSY